MNPLRASEIREWIELTKTVCPYCQSDQVKFSELEYRDEESISIRVSCKKCKNIDQPVVKAASLMTFLMSNS